MYSEAVFQMALRTRPDFLQNTFLLLNVSVSCLFTRVTKKKNIRIDFCSDGLRSTKMMAFHAFAFGLFFFIILFFYLA